jgi:hypothetical protein
MLQMSRGVWKPKWQLSVWDPRTEHIPIPSCDLELSAAELDGGEPAAVAAGDAIDGEAAGGAGVEAAAVDADSQAIIHPHLMSSQLSHTNVVICMHTMHMHNVCTSCIS